MAVAAAADPVHVRIVAPRTALCRHGEERTSAKISIPPLRFPIVIRRSAIVLRLSSVRGVLAERARTGSGCVRSGLDARAALT